MCGCLKLDVIRRYNRYPDLIFTPSIYEDEALEPRKRPRVVSERSKDTKRIIEQYDKENGVVLRRYYSMTEACVTMGLPTHYLSYKVFGTSGDIDSCVFGWKEVKNGSVVQSDSEPQYVDIAPLKEYIELYLDRNRDEVPTWSDFFNSYASVDVQLVSNNPVRQNDQGPIACRRIMEQYDRKTNKILRRYNSMADASVALGQSAHYLHYKVFGRGARFHNCLYGWRELPIGTSVEPVSGEEYASIEKLKLYLNMYLEQQDNFVPSWVEFNEMLDQTFPDGITSLSNSEEFERVALLLRLSKKGQTKNDNATQFLVEQYDLDTQVVLRRYRSKDEASIAMGQPPSYLNRMLSLNEGKARESCVFGWRELPVTIQNTVEEHPDEEYADIHILKLYMDKYLRTPKSKRITWTDFLCARPQHSNRHNMSEGIIKSLNFQVSCKFTNDQYVDKDNTKGLKRERKVKTDISASNRVIEQRDVNTNRVLRRYASMTEACVAMSLPVHYLSYKVFGKGSRYHRCVFRWTQQQMHTCSSMLYESEKHYEDISMLRSYMHKYLNSKNHKDIPSWEDFSCSDNSEFLNSQMIVENRAEENCIQRLKFEVSETGRAITDAIMVSRL